MEISFELRTTCFDTIINFVPKVKLIGNGKFNHLKHYSYIPNRYHFTFSQIYFKA